MKKFMKKSVTIILACIMAFSAVTCFAADGKQYYDYGTYVLLGDSVASGHNDLVYVDSEFKRVEDSYGAYVADELGVEYIPMACPGTRKLTLDNDTFENTGKSRFFERRTSRVLY